MPALPPVRLVWDNCSIGEWKRLFAAVPRSTLTQSLAYGQAMLLTERQRPRFGLFELDDEPIGLVQVLERRLIKMIRVARMHRGPLWLRPDVGPEVREAAWRALRHAYPARATRWTSFLPEEPAGPETAAMLARCGFRRAGVGYRTIWLDLARPEDALRRGLGGKWRGHLNAAERAELSVEVDEAGRNLPWLVRRDLELQKARGYRGPSGPLAIRLRNALHAEGGVLLLRALVDGEPVAGVLVLRHGQAATYQIGWSGPEGRRRGAHNLLLWRAILELKRRGSAWFDLGGINPEAAVGVTTFKRGLGGEEIETVGSYV